MDVIGLTAFSYDFGCLDTIASGRPAEQVAFEFLLGEISRRMSSLNPLDRHYWVPTPANRRHAAACTILRTRINGLIRARRALLALPAATDTPPADSGNDFLGNMIAARDAEGSVLSDEDLSDELLTLMVAGGPIIRPLCHKMYR